MSDTWQLKAVLSANSAGMIKALTEAGKVAKTTRKYLLDVGSAAGNFTGRIGLPVSLLSGLAAGFSFSAIKNAVVGFTDMGEAVYRGALRAGMGIEEYQRMKYVAEQAGVGVESLENAVGKLNLNIGKAAAGKNKPLAELMARLGISMRDSNGQIRAGIDLLPELADAFKRNENPAVRARMGMAMAGRQWAEIAPLLAEGSEGITASLERMSRLKGVISPEDIRGAKDLGDKFKDLGMVTKGFQMTIAKELAPVISPLIEDLVQWAAANKKLVAVEVKAFVRDLVAGMRQVDWIGIIQGARDAGAFIGKLVDFVGGTKNALIALAVAMNLQTIAAFFGLIGATARLVWYLGVMTVTAIPKAIIAMGLYTPVTTAAAGATTGLAVATNAANAAALGWLGNLKAVLGVLGSIAAAAAPLAVMWGVKEWAEDQSNDQGRVSGIQGFASMLPFNRDAEIEAIRQRNRAELGGDTPLLGSQTGRPDLGTSPPLLRSQSGRPEFGPAPSPLVWPNNRVKADGKIDININGLPQGARVDQKPVGDIPFNVNAGYRSDALGMAW